MTRLFNLESYPELCSYAHLYETEIETLIPKDSFPSAYKNFLDKSKERGYRADSVCSQQLSLRDEPISLQILGIELAGKNNNIYVVPDRINSLALRNLLKPGELYIYKSAYYYWNYFEQITNHVNLNKPVLFIDLNSLSNELYCPLQFKHPKNSPYLVPIIDNRNELIKECKNNFELWDIYNNIYHKLAQKIIAHNLPQLTTDENTVNSLKIYLQKLGIFQVVKSQGNPDNFSIIIEITTQGKTYYKSINLNIALLEDVVLTEIDCKSISQFTKNNQEFSFILISDYNVLPRFRHTLNSNNLFLPDTRFSQFPQLWLEKQQQKFPWFGQYLDQIKFQIKKPSGETQWIEVLSTEEQEHVYYEGDPETKQFVARIPETGQNDFKLLYPHTVLPIQINDQDYCINGIPQVYQITHPWEELKAKSEELRAKIEFIIKPGSAPELRVRDKDYKYTIETKLRDRLVITQTFNCIPLKTILENRRQKSYFIPNQRKIQRIIDALLPIKNTNNIQQAITFKKNIDNAFNEIHRTKQNADLFLNICVNNTSLDELKKSISRLNNSGLINTTLNYLQNNHFCRSHNSEEEAKKFVHRLIIFWGKTYKLSELLNLEQFFNLAVIKAGYKIINNEYLLFLSRIALNKKYQLNYLNLFFQSLSDQKPLYQLDKYLWGYSRIFTWYSEFYYQYQKNEFNYTEHFKYIVNHLLLNYSLTGKRITQDYKQNAFLSLIWLLTFREADSEFCTSESEEYKLAEEVVDKYRNDPVYLKIIPNKSLNEYFEELLKGNSSKEALEQLLTVD
jgi:hypothetical protein